MKTVGHKMYIECQNKCYIAILSYNTIVLGKSTCVEKFYMQVEKHIETLRFSR